MLSVIPPTPIHMGMAYAGAMQAPSATQYAVPASFNALLSGYGDLYGMLTPPLAAAASTAYSRSQDVGMPTQTQWAAHNAYTTSVMMKQSQQQHPAASFRPKMSSSAASASAQPPSRMRPSVAASTALPSSSTPKDFSRPLFVDCSIEYDLPNAPKVPPNSEPILMIHPAYQKKVLPSASTSLVLSLPPMPPMPPSVGVAMRRCSVAGCQCHLQLQQVQSTSKTAVKRSYGSMAMAAKATFQQQQQQAIQNQQVMGMMQQQQQQQQPPPKRSRMQAQPCCVAPQLPPQQQQQQQQLSNPFWPPPAGFCGQQQPQRQQQQQHARGGRGHPVAPPFWSTQLSSASAAVCDCMGCKIQRQNHARYVAAVAAAAAAAHARAVAASASASGGNAVCLGCVGGKCNVAWNKENVGIMRSL